MRDRFLPGVPRKQIEEIYHAAPGNEIASGKFDSPESSAALAANTFGFFLNRPGDLPSLPGCEDAEWPASSLALEKEVSASASVRFSHDLVTRETDSRVNVPKRDVASRATAIAAAAKADPLGRRRGAVGSSQSPIRQDTRRVAGEAAAVQGGQTTRRAAA